MISINQIQAFSQQIAEKFQPERIISLTLVLLESPPQTQMWIYW
jgi:hypothetical protein